MSISSKIALAMSADGASFEEVHTSLEKIADNYAIGFAEWKDSNFSMYRDKTYYANTSSQYFDITKYVGKEKPTKYYTSKELLEIYKTEL